MAGKEKKIKVPKLNVKGKSQAKEKSSSKGQSQSKLNMRITLILFALLPLLASSITISVMTIKESSDEITDYTHNSLVQVIDDVGTSFDALCASNKAALKAYTSAPIIKEALRVTDNPIISLRVQSYTNEYFSKLDNWEGIYLADWNSTVLAHPNNGAIGMTLREGDRLTGLQNSMLNAEDEVFNTGIMTSPASGHLIMSMYTPILDDDGTTPLGFAGCGFYIQNIADSISDVSDLGLSSAYIYIVDNEGTMLYHPDESKIGNPVENAAVKSLVAKIGEGEHPEPDVISYEFKGTNKYAAYYIGEGEKYIAVLTADEDDVLSGISKIKRNTVIICILCILIFAALALVVERMISKPLTAVSESIEQLSTGDVTADCKAQSHIKETASILNAFHSLKNALQSSMRSVKDSALVLNDAIVNVDGMTGNNVESISQINAAINEVATTSQSVAENAQTMAEKAADLGENIEILNGNVQTLFDSSQTIKNANNEATDCMSSVYAGANESVEAMKNISDKINETNSAIAEIGSAVQAIETIAAQTNLLSLNASIEAARAGEAGRGFAVVADEIRTLADSSAESAKEIKQIIENVIALSNGTVDISNRVFDVISKEQADIETAQEKFNVLSESVEASIAEIDTIRQMAVTLDQIKVELANTTTELGAISEELGASAQEVAASCQTVTDACSDTQNSTAEMRNINEDMSAAIDFFKLGE